MKPRTAPRGVSRPSGSGGRAGAGAEEDAGDAGESGDGSCATAGNAPRENSSANNILGNALHTCVPPRARKEAPGGLSIVPSSPRTGELCEQAGWSARRKRRRQQKFMGQNVRGAGGGEIGRSCRRCNRKRRCGVVRSG